MNHRVVGWIVLAAAAAALAWAPAAAAQPLTFYPSWGSGWILLDLGDLNGRLQQAGYPQLAESAQLFGGTTFFPQADAGWQWGLGGLYWDVRGGESVALSGNFLGAAFDWTARTSGNSRISAGALAGVNTAQLTVRKGIAFGFDDVLHPSHAQFSIVQRWGVWAAPYLQYELSVADSDFRARLWGGWLITPWRSDWTQVTTWFEGIAFPGPPASLGGPFVMAELSFAV